ncbi:MAG: WS/DGAT domain-containing protein [Actinomycetota bacterium]|uniref:WS/DGAT domain-containing protein n=1 Tax=Mycobacterium lentiflavum TaxID=141349 RepID=A0ABY3UWA2_MYCLN|nr:WS/DGAT domain-containing protein [Mycobacterium lentiflavum]MEE3063467.1 WS/DGAT domain-containing protein [Actinomycetota bacterium]ULP41382.1 WS/DGAT domain-containing protein [Mycobacterium lentiflavum]
MTARRMAAVDAQFYWMSAKVPSDEFLLYAFEGEPADVDGALEGVRRRARACPALRLRVEDGCSLTYPRWVPTTVTPDQVVRHDLADHSWQACLSEVAGWADSQLDLRRMPWRVHVFTPVRGIPGADDPGAVAVLQAPHALADGVRGAALAGWLFGREAPVPEVPRRWPGIFAWRAAQAAWSHRGLVRDTRAGLLVPGAGTRPPLATNARPDGVRSMRTLVRHRSQLRGPSVTVAVLAAVSTALSRLLPAPTDSLGAEIPMAKPGVPQANNHFGNVVVGLYPRLELDARLDRIATDLANGRRRFEHPATRAGDRAFAAVPAPLLRWGVSRFNSDARPAQVLGNTVVSSVNRGPADLRFGNARVVLTAGYPGLSPSMGLTHGVHGIGETIAISVHTADSVLADVDAYLELLDAAL